MLAIKKLGMGPDSIMHFMDVIAPEVSLVIMIGVFFKILWSRPEGGSCRGIVKKIRSRGESGPTFY